MLKRTSAALCRRRLNVRGDTIVEVLISIIVLSAVLTSAYGVASRATKQNLQTQEHSQALQLAQGQLETLKDFGSKNVPGIPVAGPFCFDTTNALVNSGFPAAGLPADASADNLSSYPNGCRQAINAGATAATCGDLCYSVAITRNPAQGQGNGADNDPDLYKVTVRWNGVNGGIDQVSLVYRFDQ